MRGATATPANLKALYAEVAPALLAGKDSTAIVFSPAQTNADAQPTPK
jgi:hypothetical protein